MLNLNDRCRFMTLQHVTQIIVLLILLFFKMPPFVQPTAARSHFLTLRCSGLSVKVLVYMAAAAKIPRWPKQPAGAILNLAEAASI